MVKYGIKKLFFFLTFLSSIFLTLCLLFLVLLQLPFIRDPLLLSLKAKFEEQSGYHIEASLPTFISPLHLSLEKLSIRDADGLLFQADHLRLSLSWSHLLQGGLVIKKIKAQQLVVDTQLFTKTRAAAFPLYLGLQQLEIEDLSIQQAGLPSPYLQHLNCSASFSAQPPLFHPIQGHLTLQTPHKFLLETDFHLDITDQIKLEYALIKWKLDKSSWQQFVAAASYDIKTKNIKIDLSGENIALNTFENYLKQKIEGKLNIHIQAKGMANALKITARGSCEKIEAGNLSLEAVDTLLSFNTHDLTGKIDLSALMAHNAYTLRSSFSWEQHKTLSLKEIELKGNGITATGQLAYNTSGEDFFGTLKGEINHLHFLHPELEGSGQFELLFNHEDPLFATIDFKSLSYAQLKAEALLLQIQLKEVRTLLNGQLNLSIASLSLKDLSLKDLKLSSLIDSSLPLFPAQLDAYMTNTSVPLKATLGWRLNNKALDLMVETFSSEIQTLPLLSRQPFAIHLDADRLSISTVHLQLNEGSGHSMHIQAELTSSFKENTIEGRLESKGEVAPFAKLLVPETTNLSGHLEMKAVAQGSLEKPLLHTEVRLSKGTYESLDTGSLFKNLELFIQGEGRRFTLKELKAKDALNGDISMTGSFLVDKENAFPHHFNLSLNKARFIHQDYASAVGSGELFLEGNSNASVLSGLLQIDSARVIIAEKTPPQFQSIAVTFIGEEEKKQKETGSTYKNFPLLLDLKIAIPETATLEGRHLESLWKGTLHVGGSTDKPLVEGALQIVRGSYDLHGQTFTSRTGSIHFAGDPLHKSTLYVSAEKQIEQNRIEVIVSGALSDPDIRFHSNPPMSEKEILSWILFHRGLSEITAQENRQLQQSSITISGGKGDDDFLSQIRKRFGIDRVDINTNQGDLLDPSGTNEVSLRVGKYLSKGVFVSVNKAINAEANQLALEANLSHYWKLEAEVGDDAEGKFILKWERDY